VTANNKGENSENFCLDFIREFGLRLHCYLSTRNNLWCLFSGSCSVQWEHEDEFGPVRAVHRQETRFGSSHNLLYTDTKKICPFFVVLLNHRVDRVLNFSPVVGIGTPPPPLTQARGEGDTRLRERGGGVPILTRGHTEHCGTLYMYVLCVLNLNR
jgi:hypothetical protein